MAINAGNKQRPAGMGNNTKEETAIINSSLNELIAIKAARVAFNAKMKKRSQKAKSPLRDLNFDMGQVDDYVDSMIVEQGGDKDAAEKAQNKRARALDTHRRLHAATHKGEQLDWVDLQLRAAKAAGEEDEAKEGGGAPPDQGEDD